MDISNMSGCNLIGLASSLAIIVSQDLNAEELGVLSAFFTSFADNLALLATTKNSSETSSEIFSDTSSSASSDTSNFSSSL